MSQERKIMTCVNAKNSKTLTEGKKYLCTPAKKRLSVGLPYYNKTSWNNANVVSLTNDNGNQTYMPITRFEEKN